jgi:hypothetical protein
MCVGCAVEFDEREELRGRQKPGIIDRRTVGGKPANKRYSDWDQVTAGDLPNLTAGQFTELLDSIVRGDRRKE